ncbi:MAG: VOC family protein [Pseudomonadota bacterium]
MSAHNHGTAAHFDIAETNASALITVYETVLGWPVTLRGPGYAIMETPSHGPNGALVEAEQASLTLDIAVTDLSAALAKAEAAGGAITLPTTDNGWVKTAQIADLSGNVVTLIQI